MDPNACLRRIENTVDDGDCRDDACADLHTWITHGGFAPHWAMYPKATSEYVKRYGWRPSMPESFRP
jgi:hypothetical protein